MGLWSIVLTHLKLEGSQELEIRCGGPIKEAGPFETGGEDRLLLSRQGPGPGCGREAAGKVTAPLLGGLSQEHLQRSQPWRDAGRGQQRPHQGPAKYWLPTAAVTLPQT